MKYLAAILVLLLVGITVSQFTTNKNTAPKSPLLAPAQSNSPQIEEPKMAVEENELASANSVNPESDEEAELEELSTLDSHASIVAAGAMIVPRKMVKKINLKPFNEAGEISEELAELFFLSEEETQRLNLKVDEMRRELAALTMANIAVVESTDTSTTITVQPFRETGELLKNELSEFTESLLGEDADAMLHHLTSHHGNTWGGFGSGERKVVFTLDPNPNDRNSLLKIEDHTTGIMGFMTTTSGSTMNIDKNVPQAADVWAALPAHMKEIFTTNRNP